MIVAFEFGDDRKALHHVIGQLQAAGFTLQGSTTDLSIWAKRLLAYDTVAIRVDLENKKVLGWNPTYSCERVCDSDQSSVYYVDTVFRFVNTRPIRKAIPLDNGDIAHYNGVDVRVNGSLTTADIHRLFEATKEYPR